MASVATLIAHPSNAVLSASVGEAAAEAVNAAGLYWLADGIACDIALRDGTDVKTAEQKLRDVVAELPVDLVIQAAETRRKKFLIADMDSTMIGQECIDELAAYVGLKEKVSDITERAMRGELEFEPALRERVGLLKGIALGVVDEIIAKSITLTPGGSALVRTMRAHGGYTALVSGGFTVFTGPISATIGFDEHRSNILLSEGAQLSGLVAEPILGKQAKLDALVELRARFGLPDEATLAVGDGANDLAMLGEAGLGVAYRAKPAVAAAADARLDHADLTALLYAQGYRGDEIVRG